MAVEGCTHHYSSFLSLYFVARRGFDQSSYPVHLKHALYGFPWFRAKGKMGIGTFCGYHVPWILLDLQKRSARSQVELCLE